MASLAPRRGRGRATWGFNVAVAVSASTGSPLTSPFIPPQDVRRSPSPQLPHTVHLSGETRTRAGVAAGGGNHRRGGDCGLPLARLRRFKLSGRAGPRWCAGPCSSPPHTARNCPRRRAWVEANRRRGRPPIVVFERNTVQLRARGPMQEVALARHGFAHDGCACLRSRHGTATRRNRCGNGLAGTLRQQRASVLA